MPHHNSTGDWNEGLPYFFVLSALWTVVVDVCFVQSLRLLRESDNSGSTRRRTNLFTNRDQICGGAWDAHRGTRQRREYSAQAGIFSGYGVCTGSNSFRLSVSALVSRVRLVGNGGIEGKLDVQQGEDEGLSE